MMPDQSLPKRRKALTKAQRRVMAAVEAGGLIRRRGSFGDHQAAAHNPLFASKRTIDCLWREGWIKPGDYWGSFVRAEAAE